MPESERADQNWEKVVEIFEAALEIPAARRSAFVEEACGADKNLRREVEALLAADEKAQEFIETPAVADASLTVFYEGFIADPTTNSFLPRKIGAFRLIREIGRGGMGTVYLARRDDGEFDQTVAVKIIRQILDPDFAARRFRVERQILASLEHPNIARLIDGGSTPDGLLYLVMEYITGENLLAFSENKNLTVRQRVELFEQVCSAVEYAHDRSILHRDIKPANILVSRGAAVKLLDFGIAKLSDEQFETEKNRPPTGRWLMTPEYASPEQIRGETLTAATDIYSLGVVLYELATGERPYKFPSRAPHEIARVVCEVEPRRIAANDGAADFIGSELKALILKCLAKEPSARFDSVKELRAALADYLRNSSDQPGFIPRSFAAGKEPAAKTSDQKTLAILPFLLMRSTGGETADDFLSVGLADALTIRLSQMRKLVVRPTGSVLPIVASYKNPLKIGELLDVDYILEGRVSFADGRMRVAVQLLKISDNRILWAMRFDESERDVFVLQDSITEKVVSSLVPRLTESEQKRLRQRGTDSAAAFESYLRGRYELFRYEADGILRSIKHFEEAIRLDANFALAYSGIADYYNWLEVYALTAPSECFPKAKEAARKAVELDPKSAEAYASLGFTVWGYECDFAESERLYRRSLELNPNNPRAHEWFAFLLQTVGRHDEAIAEMNIAKKLDPHSAAHSAAHHYVLFMARRYEEAEREARRGLEIDPENILCQHAFGWSSPFLGEIENGIEAARQVVSRGGRLPMYLSTLGYDLAIGGAREEAREILREMEARERNGEFFPPIFLAVIHAGLGEPDAAFARLDKNPSDRDHWRTTLLIDPRLDGLRSDRRFAELAKRIAPSTGAVISPSTDAPEKIGQEDRGAFGDAETARAKSAAAPASARPSAFRITDEGISISWRTITILAVTGGVLSGLALIYLIARNFGN
ncbi:MAG TPA: protein kinase [Pyrinomonadaceae bacterium]|jgi:serine/threonine protein kinase/tetratricopeptide (TPR) repeat protein